MRDQVFNVDIPFGGNDLRAALVSVFLQKIHRFFFDDPEDFLPAFQHRFIVFDLFDELEIFFINLFSLKLGQPLQLQFQDRFGLDLA